MAVGDAAQCQSHLFSFKIVYVDTVLLSTLEQKLAYFPLLILTAMTWSMTWCSTASRQRLCHIHVLLAFPYLGSWVTANVSVDFHRGICRAPHPWLRFFNLFRPLPSCTTLSSHSRVYPSNRERHSISWTFPRHPNFPACHAFRASSFRVPCSHTPTLACCCCKP